MKRYFRSYIALDEVRVSKLLFRMMKNSRVHFENWPPFFESSYDVNVSPNLAALDKTKHALIQILGFNCVLIAKRIPSHFFG